MVNKDVKHVYTSIIGAEEYTPGSPLYVAVKGNYLEGVKLLIEFGADPLQPHPNNTYPLGLAIKQGIQEIIKLLLEACCD